MYSVFESWMVTEYHSQQIDDAGGSLKNIFGTMTALNSAVAIIAGLFAQGISDFTGTQTTPFLTAALCLAVAFVYISKHWVRPPERTIFLSGNWTNVVIERELWRKHGLRFPVFDIWGTREGLA